MTTAGVKKGAVGLAVDDVFFVAVADRLRQHTGSGASSRHPTPGQLRTIANHVFMTSLMVEEGRQVDVRIVFGQELGVARFAAPRPIDTSSLAKLAPALNHSQTYLVAEPADGTIAIVGQTEHPPNDELRIESKGPGVVAFRSSHATIGILDRSDFFLPTLDAFDVINLFRKSLDNDEMDGAAALALTVRKIAAMRRGGTLLLMPDDQVANHLVGGISFAQPWAKVTNVQEWIKKSRSRTDKPGGYDQFLRSTRDHAIDDLAGLTGIDGAVLLNYNLAVRSFAQKISCSHPEHEIDEVDLVRHDRRTLKVKDFHGTRHQSASAFCVENADAVAVIVSQDGRATLIGKARETGRVLAFSHVEMLL